VTPTEYILRERDFQQADEGWPSSIAIPDWVPAMIAKEVRRGRWPECPVLVSLVSDPRMKGVWAELTRKKRRTGEYLHRSRATLNGRTDPAFCQSWALVLLFGLVDTLGADPPKTMLRREWEARQIERDAMAGKLFNEAVELFYFEQLGESEPGQYKILTDCAHILWRLSSQPPIGEIVIERDRGERDVQAVAVTIARACSGLFGSPLHSVTAILTAVALNCEVTPNKVRNWLRFSPIGNKPLVFDPLLPVCKD
jgi:hypothetical protein